MATKPLSAVRLGMEVNNITLAHFTAESVSQFLHHVADLVENRVVRSAGDSPWFPNLDGDLAGSVRIPSDDDGDPYVFNLFTHPAVTRCITAADPANVADMAALMRLAADSDNDTQRLLFLRVAARWNYAMRLDADNRLVYNEDSAALPGDYDDNQQGLVPPRHTIARTTVVNDEQGLAVVDAAGNRLPAGPFTAESKVSNDASATVEL